jgi:hypothetical protein
MTTKLFIDSYFGNKAYAQALIDISVRTLMTGHTNTVLGSEEDLSSLQTSRKLVTGKPRSIKKTLIILAVLIVVLLFNFPLLHMLNITRKLNNVSLPLSSKVVAMGGNGLTTDRTNIDFVVNKHYANALEAQKDIIEKLKIAGISIPQPDEKAIVSPKGGGVSNGDFINEIHISYFPAGSSHTEFTFILERTIPCGFESTGGKYAEYQCEGKTTDDAFDQRVASSEPISSVRVSTSIKY